MFLTPESDGPRSALRPLANGKLVELGKWFAGLAVTALVAYFTAQISTENRLTRLETQQEQTEKAILRQLDRIENELIRLREPSCKVGDILAAL